MLKGKSILIFGAGKIGRSFVGQLFGTAGYEVVFADIDLELVNALNEKGSYPVTVKGGKEETIFVPNVRAISALNTEQVISAIKEASILAVSVGKIALIRVCPLIAEGLKIRFEESSTNPLDIILAENMRGAACFIYKELVRSLPADYPIDRLLGLVETSIGKMVPLMRKEDLEKDPLMLFAEPYNHLIVDGTAFKGEIPKIHGLDPKKNIKAWVDRKAFIHNLGHATAAFLGNYHYPEKQFVYEVLSDKMIYTATREVMIQSAKVLLKIYPEDFSYSDLADHIDDLLNRFQNQALKDTVFRVGQDRIRKLGSDDRFMGIIRLAIANKMSYDKILNAMVYSFYFKAKDEHGNQSMQDILFDEKQNQGLEYLSQEVCGINLSTDRDLVSQIKSGIIQIAKI